MVFDAGQNPVTFSDPTGYGWGSFFKKAGSKTAGFVKKHQAEIVGAVAGAVVFGGCMVATAGAGSVGCGIAAGATYGAVSNLWKTLVQKKEKFSWSGLATDTLIGGVSSAVGGPLVGKVLSKVAPRAALAAKAAFQRAHQATIARAQNAAVAAAVATKQRISNAVANAVSSARSTVSGASTTAANGGGLYRKVANTGDFAGLGERMSKRNVRDVAREAGIGTDGVKFKINRDPGLVGRQYYGHTPDANTITLYPEAFRSTETHRQTIGHERTHIYQWRTLGKPTDSATLQEYEDAAYALDYQW